MKPKSDNQKVHVLQIVNSLDIGGLEKVVIHLVNNNNQESDVQFSIVCLELKGALASNVKEDVRIYELDKNRITYLKLIWLLLKLILINHINIIHCHNYAPLFFGVIVKKLLPRHIKIVYTEHNQIYNISPKHYKIFKVLLKSVDQIICVSKDLQSYFYQKKLASQCIVIWNGIPCPQVDEEKSAQLKAEYHPYQDTFTVGTAVVMTEQKGLIYLIQASEKIISKYPNIKFILIGDGPLKELHINEVNQLSLQNNFVFLGYKKDIANYLGILDLFILPSLWEGLSIVLLEASALGRPIIATEVGGNGEIIENGHNGLLIPPKDISSLIDAIEKLYLHEDLRKRIASNAQIKFEQEYKIQVMLNKYLDVYRKI